MPIPTLTLTQTGQVLFLPDGGDGPAPPELVAAGIEDPFQEGPTAGLLHLGTAELTTALPSDFAFCATFPVAAPRGSAGTPLSNRKRSTSRRLPPLPGGASQTGRSRASPSGAGVSESRGFGRSLGSAGGTHPQRGRLRSRRAARFIRQPDTPRRGTDGGRAPANPGRNLRSRPSPGQWVEIDREKLTTSSPVPKPPKRKPARPRLRPQTSSGGWGPNRQPSRKGNGQN